MSVEVAQGYLSLTARADGLGKSIEKEASGEVSRAGNALGDTAGKGLLGGIKGHLSGIGGVLAGAFAAVKIGGFLADAVGEAREAAKEMRLTEQVVASTGGAAGLTANQMGDLAGKLALVSGVDDDVILGGERVLATFTSVRNAAGENNDIFTQGSKIALDMSTALGTDLQGSIIQVGKALNDPVKGITALSRVGVSFTQQQKDQIKTLQASGDILGAQKIILKELNTEFGGAAAAAADPIAQFGFLKGEIKEAIGAAILPFVNALGKLMLPVLLKAAEVVTDVLAPALQNGVDLVGKKMKRAVAEGRTALRSFQLMLRSVGGITNLSFTRVLDEAGHSLHALVFGFKAAGNDITSSGFNGQMERLGQSIRDFVKNSGLDGVARVLEGIVSLAGDLVLGLSGKGDEIGRVLQDTWAGKFILAGGMIRSALDDIVNVLGRTRDSIVGIFRTLTDAVGGWFDQFTVAGSLLDRSGVLTFFDGLKDKLDDIIANHPELLTGALAAGIGGAAAGTAVIGGGIATTAVASTAGAVSTASKPAVQAVQGLIGLLAGVANIIATLIVAPIGVTAVVIVAAVVAIGAAFVIAYLKIKPFHDAVNAVARVIADVAVGAFEALKEAIPPATAAVVKFGQKVISAVSGPVSAVAGALATFATNVASIAVTVFNALAPVGVFFRDDLFPTIFAFGELVVAIAQRIGQALTAFGEAAVAAGKLIGDIIGFVLTNFIEPLVQSLGQMLLGVAQVIKGIFDIILPIIVGALRIIQAIVTEVFTIIVAIIETALGVIRGIIQIATGLISGDWDKVWEGMKTIVESIFNGIKDTIFAVIHLIRDEIKIVFDTIKNTISGVLDGVPEILKGAGNIVLGAIEGLINGASGAFNGVISVANKINPTKDIPQLPQLHIPRLAKGAVVSAPMVALLGETSKARPEIVSPQSLMRETFAAELQRVGGGGGIHVGEINLNGTRATPREASAELGWLARTSGRG